MWKRSQMATHSSGRTAVRNERSDETEILATVAMYTLINRVTWSWSVVDDGLDGCYAGACDTDCRASPSRRLDR